MVPKTRKTQKILFKHVQTPREKYMLKRFQAPLANLKPFRAQLRKKTIENEGAGLSGCQLKDHQTYSSKSYPS